MAFTELALLTHRFVCFILSAANLTEITIPVRYFSGQPSDSSDCCHKRHDEHNNERNTPC